MAIGCHALCGHSRPGLGVRPISLPSPAGGEMLLVRQLGRKGTFAHDYAVVEDLIPFEPDML
jgi:hypothetical protein